MQREALCANCDCDTSAWHVSSSHLSRSNLGTRGVDECWPALQRNKERSGEDCRALRNRSRRTPGHRTQQAQELLRLSIRLSPEPLIAARPEGEPIQPRSLTHEWQKLEAMWIASSSL